MNRRFPTASVVARLLTASLAALWLVLLPSRTFCSDAARLGPASSSDADVARLIEQLGDPDYLVRDRAQDKLAALGAQAYDALTVAARNPDLEIAARARYLLRTIDVPVVRDSDSEQVKQTLEGYFDLSPLDRLWQIRLLLALPAGDGFRAACRTVHVEDSTSMSKLAATVVLSHWPVHEEGRAAMAEAVGAELKQSGREAAQWLLQYAQLVTEPESHLGAWRQVVEGERALYKHYPSKSGPRVVAALCYDLAFWESELGDDDAAKRRFEQAQDLQSASASFYLDTASYYRDRGKFDWAVAVYARMTAIGGARTIPYVQSRLAEMYHDLGRNRDAAAAMNVIVDLLKSQQLQVTEEMGYSPDRALGRKHYFLACQARDDGDDEKYRQELEAALKHDPNELDALIAMYRLPKLDDATRKKTVAMIEAASKQLRQEAEAAPGDASAHNQFAWLVGNTTGDMKEALQHAERAVELSPDSGAYLDTLAHVYFYGLKDYEKAVECQAKAIEFTPHSGLIRKKYEIFRKAAAEHAKPEGDTEGSEPS